MSAAAGPRGPREGMRTGRPVSESPDAFEVRQEPDSIAGARLAKIAGLAIGVGLVGVFFSGLVLETNTGGIRGHEPGGGAPRPGGREIAHVEQTPILGAPGGFDLRARQREELTRYRWVDRDAGLVGIPIEQAMDLAARGAR
jgi:hypothetical protein